MFVTIDPGVSVWTPVVFL